MLEILSKVAAPVLAAKDQSHVCLESLSKKFEKDITDERGYRGNFKIGSSKNIFDCPHYAPLHSHTGTLKFSHQQIGIEEEDDKAALDYSSQDIFLHGNIDSLVASIDETPR